MILKIVCFLLIFIVFESNAFCSAWTRGRGDGLAIFEILNESNYAKTLFSSKDVSYYRTTSYKLYFEYGLMDKITIGGYLKNYNFYSQYLARNLKLKKEVNNDYYLNIFALQNIYNRNNNLFSLQYSLYIPISYDDDSKDVNPIDVKFSAELSVLYGKDGEVSYHSGFFDLSFRYFINTSLNYRLVKDSIYDQITFNYLMGFRINESSTFSASYEYKYYFENNLFQRDENVFNYYSGDNISQVKLSWNYKFLDNLATEFAFYKNYSKINATGTMFSFVFLF